MIITTLCLCPQKQKQGKTMGTRTQTWKHTSANRPIIARSTNQTNKTKKRERKNKQTNNNNNNIINNKKLK